MPSALSSGLSLWPGPSILYIEVTILVISFKSIHPFPSTSYILKAHSSFCSGVPRDVTSMARRNSLKSMNPFLSVSKVRKTWSQNCSALPLGKNNLYMSTNLGGVSLPLGQSCLKPLYHSLIVFSSYRVWDLRNSRSSWLRPCLLLMQPMVPAPRSRPSPQTIHSLVDLNSHAIVVTAGRTVVWPPLGRDVRTGTPH